MKEHRETSRQPITVRRSCGLGVISFKKLEWAEYVVRVVDISGRGVGIESPCPLEPGFVLFWNKLGGHKGGVLLWSRKQGEQYRAGIRFVALSTEDERTLQFWPPCAGQLRPSRSPEDIVAAMMQSMTRDDH